MRLLIAPDSFKETLTAAEAAEAIARGVRAALPDAELDLCPMADGGEGTVDAMVNATGGRMHTAEVRGPLGRPVTARWGTLGGRTTGRTAVIEMAAAAGLALVPRDERDPMRATTFGVGQLIVAALDAGCDQIVLGIGGSATSDGGLGALQAIGVGLSDHAGRPIAPGAAGGDLLRLAGVDASKRDRRLDDVGLRIACDVTNPLFGPNGAAAVYAPQKGAMLEQVDQLDAGLRRLATLLGGDPEAPGMGAAGGLGYGLIALCGGRLERGIELVMDAVDFDRRLERADLVITGEGKLDHQSSAGKTCLGIADRAAAHDKPTLALVGQRDAETDPAALGLAACHAIVGEIADEAEALGHAADHLASLARRAMGQWLDR